MKSKFFVVLAIIALVGFVVTLDHDYGWAQQEEEKAQEQEGPAAPFDSTKHQLRVEFSDLTDKEAQLGVGGLWGLRAAPPDPLQVNATCEPPDAVGGPWPQNTFDYGTTGEVDALGNKLDYMFMELKAVPSTATLIVSFAGDPGGNAAWYETPGGVRGVKWTQLNLVNVPPGGPLIDLDGLELWGDPGSDDANKFSKEGDPGDPKVSAFSFHGGAVGTFIPHSDIVAAVQFLGCDQDSVDSIDLDALMAYEIAPGIYCQWEENDWIIFSIRATGNWHGGEIVVLPFNGKPGSAFFLVHGGRVWDNLAPTPGAPAVFGHGIDEVDAIEAFPYPEDPPQTTPTLTQWGLIILVALLIASTVFVIVKRRKAVVRA